MTEIALSDFMTLVDTTRRAIFVGIDARVEVKARKTGNPHGKIYRRSHIVGIVNWNYETSVNNQREREGLEADFEAQGRKWGERLSPAIVTHNGGFYLTVKVEKVVKNPVYFTESDEEISREAIEPFLPASKSQPQQGVDREIIYRDYSFGSIERIRLNGQEYRIIQ